MEAINNTSVPYRPLQLLKTTEKTDDWYRQNADWFISRSNFSFGSGANKRKDLRVFYEVYNNQFPLDWFKTVTDPLTAKKPQHKSFPAKIRPVTILRTNLDLLMGEYPRRPFVYNVENMGDQGYNSYTDALIDKIHKNLGQHFIQGALQAAKDGGQQLTPEQLQQLEQNPPLPEQVATDFKMSWKDALAVKGQKWLKRNIRDKEVRRKFSKMFKDWLIAGEVFSYKGIKNEDLVYERISPLQICYDKTADSDYIEDGEWVVCRRLWTISDVVERFWKSMTKEEHETLESRAWYATPTAFFDHLKGLYTDTEQSNKIPVYHIQWKGRKCVKILTHFDEETFQFIETEVDEDYVADASRGEKVVEKWGNQVEEIWRVGSDMYFEQGPSQLQRSEINNCAACKLSYNGRRFSDLHADNISLLEIGLPFQILYIIVNYILEKTIAKSKGKILLIDQNAIPDDDDWDDEKFFYYSEALGYMLLNRNQIGVDKSWNQYQVIDMTLFENIKQLIELKESIKQEWDDTVGISRQRKGETYSSDGQGVNERAVFQSTVITDQVFVGFEEFTERELQGFLDLGKYLTARGDKSVYNDDDFGTQVMQIEPGDFQSGDLGVFVERSADQMQKLKEMKQYAQAMLQNGGKISTVLEMVDSENLAELKAKLKRIEEIEQQISQQQAESEQEHEKDIEEMREKYLQFSKLLDRENMEAEYDRKEDLAYIEISGNLFSFAKDNSQANDANAITVIEQLQQERKKMDDDNMHRTEDRKLKKQDLDMKKRKLETDIANNKVKNAQKDKEISIKRKQANKPATKK